MASSFPWSWKVRRTIASVAIALAAAGLLVGCGTRAATSGTDTPGPTDSFSVLPHPVATIADRGGPSWSGELGDTVQIDWYMQSSGETISEQIVVLQVRRVADPEPSGPYDWRHGIKVRLTSLSEQTAQAPAAYQFLTLSDGAHTQDGVAGIGAKGGPDPSRMGRSSAGWLFQTAEEGFKPTMVVLEVSAWKATWSLR
jgi:hypothetical protein